MSLNDRGVHLWWLALLVVVLDQVTKAWVSTTFQLYERLAVLPFFNLTLLHNEGAAFSFLAGAGGWQRWFFTVVAILVSGFIVAWLYGNNRKQFILNLALSLVLGGAIGNLIDRLLLGYVVDFLDFHWRGIHFPAFNIADSAISLGAVLLFIDTFISSDRTEQDAANKIKDLK